MTPPDPALPLTREDAVAIAAGLMASYLPAGWLERPNSEGGTTMTPKAERLRDALAEALGAAYLRGRELTLGEYRAGKR